MAKSLPPLTWFRSFEAAARTLSFTAAADEIGLTQSAVSQQVKSLEMRLGVLLFSRRPRGLALTDEGRKLLPQVGAALETLSAAAKSFELGPSTNLLTIATSVSVAQWLITPHLSEFREQHPDINIRILSAVWPDDFQVARADVEIRFGSDKQVGANAELLEPNALVALKSPRLQGNLADLPLIETVGTSVSWSDWKQDGDQKLKPTIYTDTYGMALQMAADGNGVALISELLEPHAVSTGLVERVDEQKLFGQEGYYLSVNEGVPEAEEFRQWLLDKLASVQFTSQE